MCKLVGEALEDDFDSFAPANADIPVAGLVTKAEIVDLACGRRGRDEDEETSNEEPREITTYRDRKHPTAASEEGGERQW